MRRRRAPAVRLFGIVRNHLVTPEPLPADTNLLNFRELSAVVANVSPARGGPPPPDIAAHRSIVAALFAHRSVVPVSPGVVFRRAETLTDWLELHYAMLNDALHYVEGRAEARVHVRMQEAARQSGGGPESGDSGLTALNAAALDIFHELGRDVAGWMVTPRFPAAPPATVPPARGPSDRGGANSSPAVAQGRHSSGLERTRDVADVSASFLVERSRWREFAEAVATEARRATPLDVAMTGPWPPYDFVRLHFGG
jgi:hypothetical protein